MRTAFIEQLILEARTNPRVFLVVGDLGYSVIEPFAEEFPDRYLNAGVAEQNMTGVAAGLASEGFHVFTYSIGNFPTLRCLEQIRNDVCYHNLPVTVVAVGAGMAYGNLGYSHHCVQDLSCLRGLPRMTILSPADPGETRACVTQVCKNPGPSYLRLGKAGEAVIHSLAPTFTSPLKVVDRSGTIALVATGAVLVEATRAATELASRNIHVDVYSMTNLSTAGVDISCLEAYEHVVTVEEHVTAGGLGELLSLRVSRPKVAALSVPQELCYEVGSQTRLRQVAGIDAAGIIRKLTNSYGS